MHLTPPPWSLLPTSFRFYDRAVKRKGSTAGSARSSGPGHEQPQGADVLGLRAQVAVPRVPLPRRERLAQPRETTVDDVRVNERPRGLGAAHLGVQERLGPGVEGLDETVRAVDRDRHV